MSKLNRGQWCRHYTGVLINSRCAVGVLYDSVRSYNGRNATWICFDLDSEVTCESLSRTTPEEIAAEEMRISAKTQQFFQRIADGICPECGVAMQQQQVGRCVYAAPCGHRLYQGKVPTARTRFTKKGRTNDDS